MTIGARITAFSLKHYRLVTAVMVVVTVGVLLAAALPSLQLIEPLPEPVKRFSRTLDILPSIRVDTDPENMLDADERVRVFHDAMKARMDLHDMVVVGVVNEADPNGVFNPSSLAKIYELTQFARGLQFDESAGAATAEAEPGAPAGDEPSVAGLDDATTGEPSGIEGLDVPSPEESQAAPTSPSPPAPTVTGVIPGDVIAPSTVDAIEPRNGTIVFSWLMPTPPETQAEADAIRRKAERIPFLNGTMVSADGRAIALYLPITSKDLSYRVYQALQDKITALGPGPEQFHITGLPVAEDTFGVEMFVQMAISAPAAMAAVFLLMLLFFRKLIIVVSPMLVAMVSVILTMGALILAGFPIHIMSSMIPIFIMPIAVLDSIHIISDFFDNYQVTRDRSKTMMAVMDRLFTPMLYTSLTSAAGFASLALTPIPPVQVFGVFVAAGILVAWLLTVTFIPAFVMFLPPKRLETFGAVHRDEADAPSGPLARALQWMGGVTVRRAKPIVAVTAGVLIVAGYGISLIRVNDNPVKWFTTGHPIRVADRVLNDHFGGTYMAYLALEATGDDDEAVFKRPEVLRWQSRLQAALEGEATVGKSNALADIVKTVHRDLLADDVDDPDIDTYFRIPDTSEAVAETLIQFESSHRPQDLAHFVTVSGDDAYRTASVWFQLTSGDNRDMEKVVRAAKAFLAKDPPPVELKADWFGLTYINVIWQDKMVVGMRTAFVGSFLVVFLLMTFLFRSPLWGLLSMVPLTVTIVAIYGAVGLVGKDYDMPVAVLSSLTLGLAVDFAIHFLARTRRMQAEHGSWRATAPHVFGEPARAISRNIIVIAVGFTPLLLAPLVPYRTVGVLLATILLVSGIATLLLLPALISLLEGRLFRDGATENPLACNCGLCAAVSVAAVALLALNLYGSLGWATLTWVAAVVIVAAAITCNRLARRRRCAPSDPNDQPEETPS
ncbi:MAG: efflux RND transporter permease subunit [Planctomycetota bacterium]